MGFFDSLERFVSDFLPSLKPEEVVKLRSCKNCFYYTKGYCRQTSPATKILSEYYAQGCIFYSPESPVTSPTIGELKIKELTTLREPTHTPKSFFINPFFHQGFTGWMYNENLIGNAEVKTEEGYYNTIQKFLSILANKEFYLQQEFPIALGVDWYSDFYFYLRSKTTLTNLIEFRVLYSDGDSTATTFQVTASNTWQKKQFSWITGKYIDTFLIRHQSSFPQCDLGWLSLVF